MTEIVDGMRFRMKYKDLWSEVEIAQDNTAFIVKKGSQLPKTPQEEFETNHRSSARLRERLVAEGVIVAAPTGHLEFSRDCEFDSLSTATSVIRGGPGTRDVWKGLNNKDYQALLRLGEEQSSDE